MLGSSDAYDILKLNYNEHVTALKLSVFYICWVDISVYNEKVLGDSRIMKGGRVTIPKKVREKLSLKDVDFLTYLLTSNGLLKIKKLEFYWDKSIKQ